MTHTTDDIAELESEVLDLLTAVGLRPRTLVLTPDEQDRTDAIADAALATLLSTWPESPSPTTRRRARLRGVVLVAAAAVLALVVVVARPWDGGDIAAAQTPAMLSFSLTDPGEAPLVGEPAADLLRDLATRAARQPAEGRGPVQLVVLDGWWLSVTNTADKVQLTRELIPSRSVKYLLPDGYVRSIERRGKPLDKWGRVGNPEAERKPDISDETFRGSSQGPYYADTLSTIPAILFEQLVPDPSQCSNLTACVGLSITNLHYSYVVSPKLNAALWRVLADQPSITTLGATRDRLGRDAVALALPGGRPDRQRILFADPETGQFLGNEEILARDSTELGLRAPAVLDFTALSYARRVGIDDVPRPVDTD